MGSVKLGKKYTVRKMEYSVCHEHGAKKKSDSPMGIEPMTRTPVFNYI